MKTAVTSVAAVSALLAVTSTVVADPISSSSSKSSSSSSLRGSLAASPSPNSLLSAVAPTAGEDRELQLAPESGMQCYARTSQSYRPVGCTPSLLGSCQQHFFCSETSGDAFTAGIQNCPTAWVVWPAKADGQKGDDQEFDDIQHSNCVYAVSCCTSSS
jgi:hypothetical protein